MSDDATLDRIRRCCLASSSHVDAWTEVTELLEAAYRQAAPRALVAQLDQRR